MKQLTIIITMLLSVAMLSQETKKHRFYFQVGVDPAITLNLKDSNGNKRPGGGKLDISIKGGVERTFNSIKLGASLEVESFEAINFFSIGGQAYTVIPLKYNFEGIAGIEYTRISRWKPEGARKTSYAQINAISLGINMGLRYVYKNKIFIELNGNLSTSPDEFYYYYNSGDDMTYRYSNTLSIGFFY